MCQGGQSESAGLLHQERVFIWRLLRVVLERHTLPPQPVKLALLKLVPHWEIHGKASATRIHFNITDTAAHTYTYKHPPNGPFMWSIEATKCRLGRDASCPSAPWVFSPRSISPSILWISRYTWRPGPARTHFRLKHKKSNKLKTDDLQTHSLSLRVWVMYWIWSEGVRKLPWCSRTSHVRAFKICNKSILWWG